MPKMQRFPVYYTGSGEFKADGRPSGMKGAVARVDISLNNRPHEIIAVRLRNSYPRFPTPTYLEGQLYEEGAPVDPVPAVWSAGLCCLLDALDDEQLVEVELAQQNVVIKEIHQRELCGANGVHWHPWPCSYPFRGGNNMKFRVKRIQDYPYSTPDKPLDTVIKPTLYVAILGWMFVSDEMPPAGPPSTDFDVDRG